MKPTLAQAKQRYKSRTRGLLTSDFRKLCDGALWGEVDGYPVLESSGVIHLHFRIENGSTFAVVGKPASYKDGKYAGPAFGAGDRA